MSEHHNGYKKQGKAQTTLQGQQKFNDDTRIQKQPGQDLKVDQAGGPLKEQTNENKPSEET